MVSTRAKRRASASPVMSSARRRFHTEHPAREAPTETFVEAARETAVEGAAPPPDSRAPVNPTSVNPATSSIYTASSAADDDADNGYGSTDDPDYVFRAYRIRTNFDADVLERSFFGAFPTRRQANAVLREFIDEDNEADAYGWAGLDDLVVSYNEQGLMRAEAYPHHQVPSDAQHKFVYFVEKYNVATEGQVRVWVVLGTDGDIVAVCKDEVAAEKVVEKEAREGRGGGKIVQKNLVG